MKLHVTVLAALVAALAWVTPVDAQTPPTVPLRVSPTDRPTIQKLHDANQVQIQMGHLAREKGASKASRDLGRVLIADHEAVERQIDAYLRKRGSDLKSLATATSVDPDHDLLATKAGTEFERSFGLQVVADQTQVIDMLESARIQTPDDDLRAIFDALLPTSRQHRTAARDIVAASVRS